MNAPKRIISTILTTIAVVCALVAGILAIQNYINNQHSEEAMEDLRANVATLAPEDITSTTASSNSSVAETSTEATTSQDSSTEESAPSTETTVTEDVSEPVENPYVDIFLQNKDMVAWINIPDTKIDYPVMWTPRDENYYLYRAFDGSEDKNGSLILDTDSSLEPLTTDLIIHGHNMKSGAMFGNLTDYEDSSYWKDHKYISLYTEECERRYEVIAVFRSQVYKKSDQVFKFYKFFQADTEEEFDDFYQNIKEMSLYDTGVTAEFGDHFLTLSTCVYHVENGRFVVVAKEIESGDTYLPIQEQATTNN